VPRLERTFRAVRRLRDKAGLGFIVPALPSTTGALVVPVGDSFVLSVYAWLDARPARDADHMLAADLVGRLHRAWGQHPVRAVREDFRLPHRAALEVALAGLAHPWAAGPYGEPARAQLTRHQAAVRSALARYDALATAAVGSTADWCLTHGEPGGGNLLRDPAGRCYLVDWESARIAPPERDLVELRGSPEALARYQGLVGGRPPRAELLRLYELWYALAETAVYLRQFRGRHEADANLAEAWRNFLAFLPGRQGPAG
jgi:spectinomycin phosphotransferase